MGNKTQFSKNGNLHNIFPLILIIHWWVVTEAVLGGPSVLGGPCPCPVNCIFTQGGGRMTRS